MNHSNKDGASPAESGEGRPLIKENAGQPNTYPTQSFGGVAIQTVTIGFLSFLLHMIFSPLP